MKFTVTRNDLKGEYLNNFDCPIARCIKRTLNTKNVSVFSKIHIEGKDYLLPKEADNKAVDRARSLWGKIIGGFTFEIKEL